MKPVVGEYRYGGDKVYIGIGKYDMVIHRGRRSNNKKSPIITLPPRKELIDVKYISRGYDYVTMGWDEAHNAAYTEAANRGWK